MTTPPQSLYIITEEGRIEHLFTGERLKDSNGNDLEYPTGDDKRDYIALSESGRGNAEQQIKNNVKRWILKEFNHRHDSGLIKILRRAPDIPERGRPEEEWRKYKVTYLDGDSCGCLQLGYLLYTETVEIKEARNDTIQGCVPHNQVRRIDFVNKLTRGMENADWQHLGQKTENLPGGPIRSVDDFFNRIRLKPYMHTVSNAQMRYYTSQVVGTVRLELIVYVYNSCGTSQQPTQEYVIRFSNGSDAETERIKTMFDSLFRYGGFEILDQDVHTRTFFKHPHPAVRTATHRMDKTIIRRADQIRSERQRPYGT